MITCPHVTGLKEVGQRKLRVEVTEVCVYKTIVCQKV